MTRDKAHPMHGSRPSSPSAAAAQAWSRLTDLARATMQTEANLARQSVELTWATVAGDLDRASANKAYFESVARASVQYWRAVGELGVDFATDLVALGKIVYTTVLREVAATGRKPGRQHEPSAAAGSTQPARQQVMSENGGPKPDRQATLSGTNDGSPSTVLEHDGSGRPVAVTLHGSVGGRAEGPIMVANQHPRPRRIQLSAGDLVDSAGAVVAAGLNVSPTSITVPKGKEQSISLGVDLDDESFSAGQRYTCTVKVNGGDQATIEVTIDVTA